MKNLEQIARKMFIEFSMRKTGMHLDWRYLSKERKLSWMKEIVELFDMCFTEVSKELELPGHGISGLASYERGFLSGQRHEADRIKERIRITKELLHTQLEDFEANVDEDNKN